MVQSLDPTILSSPSSRLSSESSTVRSVIPQLNGENVKFRLANKVNLNKFILFKTDQQARQGSPLVAASKMVPVPETLMSPDCPPTNVHHRVIQQPSNVHANQTLPHQKVSSIKASKGNFSKTSK